MQLEGSEEGQLALKYLPSGGMAHQEVNGLEGQLLKFVMTPTWGRQVLIVHLVSEILNGEK